MDKFKLSAGHHFQTHFQTLSQGPITLDEFSRTLHPLLNLDYQLQITDGFRMFSTNVHGIYYGHMCLESKQYGYGTPATDVETLDSLWVLLSGDNLLDPNLMNRDITVYHRIESTEFIFGIFRKLTSIELMTTHDGTKTLMLRLGAPQQLSKFGERLID